MITESDYREAQENPRLRGRFLREIDLEAAANFVSKVKYRSTDEPMAVGDIMGNIIMGVQGRFLPLFFSPIKFKFARPRIYVFPGAFSPDVHPCIDDFLSTLIDHEGHHAQIKCEKPYMNLSIRGIENWEEELETYDHQIKQMMNRSCSDSYKKFVNENREMYKNLINQRKYQPDSQTITLSNCG